MPDDANKTDEQLANEVAGQLRSIPSRDTLPKNPKRVIRTFGSDYAALSGSKPPARVVMSPARAPAATPTPPGPPVKEAAAPRRAEPPPPIPLQKSGAGAPSARPNEARIVSESIVAEAKPSFFARLFGFAKKKSARAPVPPAPPAPKPAPAEKPIAPPLPTPAPPPLPPVRPEPSAPPAPASEPAPSYDPTRGLVKEEDREAILARLRAKVAAKGEAPPVAPPVFPSPKLAPAEPPPPPAPLPQPARPPEPETPERLRTYRADFGGRVSTERASAFSVLAADADAARPSAPPIAAKGAHGLRYALIGTVLVVGGSLIVYFAYGYFRSNQPVPIVISTTPASLVTPDDTATIAGTDGALMAALAQSATSPLGTGDVRAVYLSAGTTTEPGGALIAALQLPAPDILLRNIKDDSTVGVVHAGSETRAFFILDADSYERVFAGMLSWEPTIGSDLAPLYPAYADAAASTTATTTATTTAPLVTSGFIDEVVASHDVRALKDGEGRTLLLYGFQDQNTLIIARDEEAFTVLLARLSASRS